MLILYFIISIALTIWGYNLGVFEDINTGLGDSKDREIILFYVILFLILTSPLLILTMILARLIRNE